MTPPIEPPEIIRVDRPTVACDGGGGVLGHPRVYLSLERGGRAECPYCDRLFVRDEAAPADHPESAER
jgi:uncharacterized Zn-finger protein